MPWILVLHPVVLFTGFFAYQEADRVHGSGLAGLAAWGVLWPLVVEFASQARPHRVTRLLRLYREHHLMLPFGAEYRKYRRKVRPLRCTELTLICLVIPTIFAGVYITGWISKGAL